MQAVVIEDGALVWREAPVPVAGDTELLVAVRAAGVNGADLAQLAGRYPAPPGSPRDIPGLELAGEVLKTGRQVTRHRVGDRVMALVGGGAQATLAVVDEAHALAVPAGLGWPEAGGFVEAFATAHDALFTQARLTMGERLLVTGAAGGVGTAAVQMAAAAGAQVTAAVRDPRCRDEVEALGAAEAIDPAEIASHGPFDVVLELVGAASLPAALGALATGGRALLVGVGSGAVVELDLMRLMSRRARLLTSTLRARRREEKAAVMNALAAHVVPLLANGRIRVPVYGTLPLAEAAAGYERFAAPGKLGKFVLVA